VTDQSSFELRDLCGDTSLYGHDGIHSSLMNFCVRWSDGLDILTDDAAAIGDVLTKAAAAYRATDSAAAGSLGDTNDPAALVPGKPEAIEETPAYSMAEATSPAKPPTDSKPSTPAPGKVLPPVRSTTSSATNRTSGSTRPTPCTAADHC
jgi:hypothetical protein